MSAPKRGRPAPRPPASTRASSRTVARTRTARTAQPPAKRPAPRAPQKQQLTPQRAVAFPQPASPVGNPWHALWAMMIGFFMILVDSTIVAVANPSIMEQLATGYDGVIWVTSAYLLAYAVPLLVAGRLGDQFGPKNLYLVGLFVFTAASLWCGLSGSIEELIAARVVQGIGAALLTPQTLSTITRIFPPDRRGAAMSVWGATAGVATLLGPLAGGVLVDHLGWEWIFFVNVPIGVLGLVLGFWLIPVLPTHKHRFDVLGVLLSGVAMFLVVFGLQEGEARRWPLWIWLTIGAGVLLMAVFLYWQRVNRNEPLIPLRIFADRDFSLSNVGVAVIGFAVTAMIVPVMFYAQVVCGLTPTRAALLTAPMAVISGVLAPLVGRIVDRAHPRTVIGFGFSLVAIALTWLSWEMTPTTPMWRLLLPFAVLGGGMAFIWAPLAATATRNLPSPLAGAGSGVYNATRQLGSVLGSAAIAAFMTSRIAAEMPAGQTRPPGATAALQLPEFLRAPFADALSQSMLLPAFVALFGVVAALFMVGAVGPASARRRPVRVTGGKAPVARPVPAKPAPARPTVDRDSARANARTEIIPLLPDPFFHPRNDLTHGLAAHPEGYIDDDEDGYVEYLITLPVVPEVIKRPPAPPQPPAADEDDRATEPIAAVADAPSVPAPVPEPVVDWPAEPDDPVIDWHAEPVPADHEVAVGREAPAREQVLRPPAPEPIGFAHNGFHVDDKKRFQPLPPPSTLTAEPRPADGFDRLASRIDGISANFTELMDRQRQDLPEFGRGGHRHEAPPQLPSRHGRPDEPESVDEHGRHYREDPDDSSSHGRHSLPQRD